MYKRLLFIARIHSVLLNVFRFAIILSQVNIELRIECMGIIEEY